MLVSNSMGKGEHVWSKTWKLLADDIIHSRRIALNIRDLHINDDDLQMLCLMEIEKIMHVNGRSLKEFDTMPDPDMSSHLQFENKLIADELNFNKEHMSKLFNDLIRSLTLEQKAVCDEIYHKVVSNLPGMFFLYGFGGTGKTYIWNTLSALLRSKGLIVLNVASSGIASLLLPGGRTVHSRFSIPISINDCSTCNIKQGSPRAQLLQRTSLIISDEAPMLNKHCFEALDRTLNDLIRHHGSEQRYVPFGGKVVVLDGDFRQILPVIQKGSRSEIVESAINFSYLWKHCKVLRLTKNMRLFNCKAECDTNEIQLFADWILQVGDGQLNQNCETGTYIVIPEDLAIMHSKSPLQSLINFTYPSMLQELGKKNFSYFEERAVLAPTLESVELVNNLLLSSIDGYEKEYLSVDTPCLSDEDAGFDGSWLTTEFLNTIKCSGIPNHKLILKVGVPIMLLRNLDQPQE